MTVSDNNASAGSTGFTNQDGFQTASATTTDPALTPGQLPLVFLDQVLAVRQLKQLTN